MYKDNIRRCDHCGKPMLAGYMIEGGLEHYCSDVCLNQHYTEAEYLELYNQGNGETCYTEWEDDVPCANHNTFDPYV